MTEQFTGVAAIEVSDSEYLRLSEIKRLKGELTDYRDLQLRFALEVDQTYLQRFVAALEKLHARLHA